MIEKYVRLATENDLNDLVEMAKLFYTTSPYQTLTFDPEHNHEFFRSIIRGRLSEGVVLVGLKDREVIGFLAGIASKPPFSSQRVAVELGWFVKKEHRKTRTSLLLYSAYEDWARRVGCSCVQTAYLPTTENNLDEFYKKHSYTQVESSYLKVLN